ncbi:MAG: hypothetical protein ABI039_05275, partial [Vicinamibacterales bacterium]
MRFRAFAVTLLLAAAASSLVAQPQPRRATTITALRAYPGFYHQQTVLVVGEVKGLDERATVGNEEGAVKLVAREVPREGQIEVRGQFLDIGRMSSDDPRLIPFSLVERIRTAYQDRWPKPGEELILILGGSSPAPATGNATTPPLRSVAMEPSRYDGQQVTITGQFRGRNLFGDLPEAPVNSRYQFVLRSGDAAVWVMGVQPKGKTFNFDPTKRIDSGRWVKVQGTVRTAKGLTWLEGTSIELAPAPEETIEVTIDLPPPPPVEILFTAPTQGEADVKVTERIRMQLSRDLNPDTLKDRIRFTPDVAFTTHYTK